MPRLSRSLRIQSPTAPAGASIAGSVRRWRPKISEERSTAITRSAPIARASDTGTGLTSPPSTSTDPSRSTGMNNPGTAMEARTASSVEPRRSHNSAPVCSEVATAANGMGNSSIGRSTKLRRKKPISARP